MSIVGGVVFVLQGLLGVMMAGSGGTKLVGSEMQKKNFDRFGYPEWFRVVTGGIEVVGAICLLVAFVSTPSLAIAGSILIVVILIGAITTHILVGDSLMDIALPASLLVIALVISLYHAGILA